MNKEKVEIQPLAYSIEDAAKLLGLSRATIYRLLRDKRIKAVKSGHRLLFRRADLEAYLANLPEADAFS